MYKEIQNVINTFKKENITAKRKETLQMLIDFIQDKINNKEDIRLNFICTHNSRRSHLAQIWAQTASLHFNIKNVFCYSGGTEVTAMFPMVAKTLETQGFKIKTISNENNPVYTIKNNENEAPIICFSKTYNDKFNPTSKFAAIMTCSQADGGCPIILGAEKRFIIAFDDPKAFDNTAEQSEKYKESSLQIANELFYVFSRIITIL